jgi:hypothetical protein
MSSIFDARSSASSATPLSISATLVFNRSKSAWVTHFCSTGSDTVDSSKKRVGDAQRHRLDHNAPAKPDAATGARPFGNLLTSPAFPLANRPELVWIGTPDHLAMPSCGRRTHGVALRAGFVTSFDVPTEHSTHSEHSAATRHYRIGRGFGRERWPWCRRWCLLLTFLKQHCVGIPSATLRLQPMCVSLHTEPGSGVITRKGGHRSHFPCPSGSRGGRRSAGSHTAHAWFASSGGVPLQQKQQQTSSVVGG